MAVLNTQSFFKFFEKNRPSKLQVLKTTDKKRRMHNQNKSYMRCFAVKKVKYCKKITKETSFIKIKFLENKIKSNKTINLINFFAKNKRNEIYFLMGADNLINFHKWHKWQIIAQKSNIIVFDRYGYKIRSLKSKTYKSLNKDKLKFINFNKVNISSSQLRKI